MKILTPQRQALSAIIVGQHDASALVVLLVRAWNPCTVFRTVVSIIINTFKRVFGRALAHILKKVCKIKPSFAYGNATSSIIVIGGASIDETTLFHCHPNIVRTCPSLSMPSVGCDTQATAARCDERPQIPGADLSGISTSTAAYPFTAPVRFRGETLNGQLSKHLPRQVKESTMCLSHWIKAISFVNVVRAVSKIESLSARPFSILAKGLPFGKHKKYVQV